jgi:hypothetical protein
VGVGERVESSIVNGTFGGVFANEVVCCKCSNCSLKSETFFDLEIDVVVHSVARRRSAPPESADLQGCVAKDLCFCLLKKNKKIVCARFANGSRFRITGV